MAPISATDGSDSNMSNKMIQYQNGSPFQITFEVLNGALICYQMTKSFITSMSRSRMDSNALIVCLKIGKALQWSQKGQDRFYEAKENLTLVTAWEKILQFGFHWEGPVSQILALDEGERFAALTACLTEVYTVNFVGKIYMALVTIFMEKNKDDPFLQDTYTPSLQQMRIVIERFAGIFSTSEFSATVEDFMSYDNHAVITGGTQPRRRSKRKPSFRTIAYPQCIAEALYELFQLSRDNARTRQVQFVGGADAVAVAGIGIYLLDLPTQIYRNDQGGLKIVHKSYSSDEKPRVMVIISDDMQNTTKLTQGKVVSLHPIDDIIKQNKEMNPDPLIGGRCRWSQALSVAFPGSFERLIGMYANFGPAMGSAARIFQALAEGDENVPQHWLISCRTYFESSFGLDYVSYALRRFPELDKKHMRTTMREKAQLSTYGDAEQAFESSMAAIAEACNCKVCCIHGTPSASSNQPPFKGSYCLLTLATTIIRLVRELSGIDVVNDKLLPSRKGVEWFYNQQRARHQRQRQIAKSHTNNKEELYVSRILDYARLDKGAPEFSPLAVANTLFSGVQRKDDILPGVTAIESQGICCYYRMLLGPSRDARVCARICVIPGCIESASKRYCGVVDLDCSPFRDTCPYRNSDTRPTYCVHEEAKKLANNYNLAPLKILVNEHLGDLPGNTVVPWLELGFEVPVTDGKTFQDIGPAKALENIVRGTGLTNHCLVRCNPIANVADAISKLIPHGSPTTPYEELKYGESQVFIFRGDTATALIAAWGCWLPVFLTESNCVACAVGVGIRNSWKNFAIICSEESFNQVSK